MKAFKLLMQDIFTNTPSKILGGGDINQDPELKTAIPHVIDERLFRGVVEQATKDFSWYNLDLPLDLPFKVCSFELYDDLWMAVEIDDIQMISLRSLIPVNLLAKNSEAAGKVVCIVVKEVSPNNYVYYAHSLFMVKDHSKLRCERQVFEFKESFAKSRDTNWRIIVATLLKCLDHARVVETTNHVIKQRVGNKTMYTPIPNVVHVYPRTQKTHIAPRFGGSLEYTHRWLVRGHWMKLPNRIGKDRAGNPIEGFTWRKEHIKGPEGKLLIKKTRVVHRVQPESD